MALRIRVKRAAGLLAGLVLTVGPTFSPVSGQTVSPQAQSGVNMILIEGGTFTMGDVFAEGEANERPVHEVTVSSFYLARNEVTVGDFTAFVEATGFRTSAEATFDPEAIQEIGAKFRSGELSREEMQDLKKEMLGYGGTGYWDPEGCHWTGYVPNINWKNPGFEQNTSCPVVAISPDDARAYLNWLSEESGLPAAYDLASGGLLDGQGQPTDDLSKVRGFRLPTEAEWEFAAREGGRKVRFGNGKNTARSGEMNIRANAGDFNYLEPGEYRKVTMRVGSFAPNSLGLCDMSGNAWEWTADYAPYSEAAQTNPCVIDGMHALRGGRWGGDASEARVFHRTGWARNDRCNNSGFRAARSK